MRPYGAVRAFNGVGVGSATMHSARAVVTMMHVVSIAKVIFIFTTLFNRRDVGLNQPWEKVFGAKVTSRGHRARPLAAESHLPWVLCHSARPKSGQARYAFSRTQACH